MRMLAFLLAITGVVVGFTPILAASSVAPAKEAKIFPFPYYIDDLDNGLRVVTVPLPYPDLVSFYAIVRAGSRNEVEPGKSGFAHFFEHMMFRGTKKYPPEKYNELMKQMGAEHNAFTTDDFTAYHALFGKKDLPMVMELEADRFQNLEYPVDAFRTEAKAVLGEYNKNSANPLTKLFEVIRDKSFESHTYKHTTMGFIKDIEDMPNQYSYSKTFFDRFYRPENVVLLVAGDVSRDDVVALARKQWAGWKRGSFTQQIPAEPEPKGPLTTQVDWPTPTLPWVVLAYRGPAFSDEKPDMVALDLAGQIAFSESSPLYQKLVIDEQKVDNLIAFFGDQRDPGLLYIAARVKEPADVEYVKERLLGTVRDLTTTPVDAKRLDAVKSNLKYGFALSMDSTSSVARALAGFLQQSPTPETINKVYALYDRQTPESILAMSKKYFTDKGLTTATLATKGTLDALAPAAAPVAVHQLLKPAEVPLVSFRVLLHVGAANDPPGKEGVAALTASLLSHGASKTMSYQEIIQALYPMAADVSSQVDKEMTVFSGTTHVDTLDSYYKILSSMLLDPGWNEEDFNRLKDDAINFLKVNLRGNNDEELGKEVLYQFIYGPKHPYGHHSVGTLASLEKLTLQDVKDFYAKNYTRANLTMGLSGGYPAPFAARAAADFSRLPTGVSSKVAIPEPPPVKGQQLLIVQKDTRATAISLGFPIGVTRADPDWAALWLAASYLGQHRSSNSYLYQRIREIRGLNYGDYAYVEYFPRGMFQFQPDPNLGRQRQIFQIWIRPVEPANGHFALRIAMYELDKLVREGLTAEQFESTRKFLDKHAAVLATTQSTQLGYSIDGEYYKTGDFVPWVRRQLSQLTREDVNRAIRKYFSIENVKIVIVTKDAEALKSAILANTPSPITYNAPKPAEILEEDKIIQAYRLAIAPGDAAVVDLEKVFNQ
ncbi:MAG TPA: pitrilysin family protein [Candidatus Polarisedimenticolia bacterium]|nr:pitrilysin family protein [Candidatus Polarisedimenticolia bacterium]